MQATRNDFAAWESCARQGSLRNPGVKTNFRLLRNMVNSFCRSQTSERVQMRRWDFSFAAGLVTGKMPLDWPNGEQAEARGGRLPLFDHFFLLLWAVLRSAHLFFIISDSRFRPAAVIPPLRGRLLLSSPLALLMVEDEPLGSKADIARSIRSRSSLSCCSICSLFKRTPRVESAN